jgi:hypothetical protein
MRENREIYRFWQICDELRLLVLVGEEAECTGGCVEISLENYGRWITETGVHFNFRISVQQKAGLTKRSNGQNGW